MDGNEAGFLDLLYGAAVEPRLWVPVMERLADMMGGNSAWLSRLSVADGTGSGVLARIDPAYPARYQAYYAGLNPFSNAPDARAFMRNWKPRITTDDQWLPKADLVGSEYYNDFLAPQDAHSFAMIRLAAQDLDVCAITVNRGAKHGAFDVAQLALAERLHPHLIRAFKLTEAFAVAGVTTDGMAAAFDQASFAIFLIDDSGRLRRTNRSGDRLIAACQGLCASGGRLRAVGPEAGRELDALIAQAATRDGALRAGGSMVLRSAAGGRLSITVAPIHNERVAVFDHRPLVMVCVIDPDVGATISEDRVRGLFSLTPAEARVAVALMGGSTARQVAESLGVSVHTVRHHLQSIFEKTGAARQSELLTLLTRAAGPLN